MTKSELRLTYKELRNSLSNKQREEMNQFILMQILQVLEHKKHVGIFLAIEKFKEIDLQALILNKTHHWYAPKSNFENIQMEFVEVNRDSKILINPIGIPEPDSELFIEPKLLDAIIVPMLISDLKGFRVGYGKGFYDNYLLRCRPDCLKIGVNYFPPIDKISDIEAHDQKLNLCIYPH